MCSLARILRLELIISSHSGDSLWQKQGRRGCVMRMGEGGVLWEEGGVYGAAVRRGWARFRREKGAE